MRLSARYINDRFLPDKAIDLMDEAASRVRMEQEDPPMTEESGGEDRRPVQGQGGRHHRTGLREGRPAAGHREGLSGAGGDSSATSAARDDQEHRDVNAEDIAAVVSGWTGIPVTRLTEDEGQRLLHMEEVLMSVWWVRTRP